MSAQVELNLPPPRPWMPKLDNGTVGFPLARRGDPDTSKEAAVSVYDVAEVQRALILGALACAGVAGLNASECDQRLGFPAATSGRRLHEMVNPKKGPALVHRTDEKRETASGRMAYVYILARHLETRRAA